MQLCIRIPSSQLHECQKLNHSSCSSQPRGSAFTTACRQQVLQRRRLVYSPPLSCARRNGRSHTPMSAHASQPLRSVTSAIEVPHFSQGPRDRARSGARAGGGGAAAVGHRDGITAGVEVTPPLAVVDADWLFRDDGLLRGEHVHGASLCLDGLSWSEVESLQPSKGVEAVGPCSSPACSHAVLYV
jgi:hypothetical protein